MEVEAQMIDHGENCSNEDVAMNLGDLTERAEKVLPLAATSMAFVNSSVEISPSLLKSAKSAISFHRLAMISWFFLNVASSQLPLPSMTVLRTAKHSKSFLSKKPLLS